MNRKQLAEELVDTALSLTDNHSFNEAIMAIKLAALLLEDEAAEVELKAGKIADLVAAGKLKEAQELSVSFGIRLEFDESTET